MNTQHLKYALEIERTRSITQAASNLYMAQPNLSKAIRELEEQLGYEIFVRSSRGVTPTEKGRAFLEYAHNVLVELEKMEALGRQYGEGAQSVSVAIPRASYLGTAFTCFISELDPRLPIDARLQESNSMQVIESVRNGSAQLGVIRYQDVYESYYIDYLESNKLRYETVWSFAYLLLMSRNHAMAKLDEVRLKDLHEYIEIVHGDTVIPYLSEGQYMGGGSNEAKRISLYERQNQFDLLGSVPDTFMWSSPIPQETIKRYQLAQRKCLDSKAVFKDVMIYRENYRFDEMEQRFIRKMFASRDEVASVEYV